MKDTYILYKLAFIRPRLFNQIVESYLNKFGKTENIYISTSWVWQINPKGIARPVQQGEKMSQHQINSVILQVNKISKKINKETTGHENSTKLIQFSENMKGFRRVGIICYHKNALFFYIYSEGPL